MSRLRCFLTPRAWILSSRAENESLGGGLSRTFFAAMRLGEDLGAVSRLVRAGVKKGRRKTNQRLLMSSPILDPSLPADHSPLSSGEMRGQFQAIQNNFD